MRVAHVVAHPPFREGTGTACYYNAAALRELGCDVTVYAPNVRLRREDRALVDYRFMSTWLAVENAFLNPAILSIRDVDVVHLHYPFIMGSELAVARSVAGRTPLVVTYHNDLIGSGIRRPSFWVYNRLAAPVILGAATKMAGTARDYARSSCFGQTVFARRERDVVEVGNGVDGDRFHPGVDGRATRAALGVAPEERLFLFVGRLDRAHVRKGLPTLFEALRRSGDRRLKLAVVGDGVLREQYRRRAAAAGLGERVMFCGRVSQAALPRHYAACDAVVIPSRPPEAFGLALAEGMASGKPAVGGNIPGVRTLIVDGETGHLVDPLDPGALARVLTRLAWDDARRRRMGEAAHARIERHFTWRRVGERLLTLYGEIVR